MLDHSRPYSEQLPTRAIAFQFRLSTLLMFVAFVAAILAIVRAIGIEACQQDLFSLYATCYVLMPLVALTVAGMLRGWGRVCSTIMGITAASLLILPAWVVVWVDTGQAVVLLVIVSLILWSVEGMGLLWLAAQFNAPSIAARLRRRWMPEKWGSA